MDVDAIADRLYALPLEEFTTARDDAAKKAEEAPTRKAVKSLRKPTAAAHTVNRLVRERTDDVDSLLALGDDMRAAMAGGDTTEVRRLSEQRRELIGALVDPDMPAAVQQDVTATLEAATADPGLGAAVRSGRLVKPLRYAGFGAMPDLDDAVATPLRLARADGKRKPRNKAAAPKQTAKKSAARSDSAEKSPGKAKAASAPPKRPDLTAAREHVLDLAGLADDAQRRFDAATRNAVEARKVLEQAEAERAESHKAARAAHAEAEKARRELGRLERS